MKNRTFQDVIDYYCNGVDYPTAYNELLYKPLFGKTAKQLRAERGNPKYTRNCLNFDELQQVTKAEKEIIGMLAEDRFSYSLVRRIMNKEYRIKNLLKNRK